MSADGSVLPPHVRMVAHQSDTHSWAMATRAPDPRLRSYVLEYQGYKERASRPMRRLQAPFAGIPLILTFGPTIDIISSEKATARQVHRSFLAGLHDVHVFTEYEGDQCGFQLNFTLVGAYRFLNITMSDLANRCVNLGDLLGEGEAERLADRFQEVPDWPARFDLMDEYLLARLARGRPMSPDVVWALRSLQQSGGARSIGALSRDLSCSRKALIQRFHAQVGLSPKAVANILRFERAVERIKVMDEERWADLALCCGYYDQAHFNREFRRYSGRTPSEFEAALMPDGVGVAG